jgi:hypothetical protein
MQSSISAISESGHADRWANVRAIPLLLLLPVTLFWGGSTSLLHWGPGFLAAGIALLATLSGSSRNHAWAFDRHTAAFLMLLAFLVIRASSSGWQTLAAADIALAAFAATGYLIARSAGPSELRWLGVGTAAAALLHTACFVFQLWKPDWNPVYPARTSGWATGLIAHYNHAAAFAIGSMGLLLHRLQQATPAAKALQITAVSGLALALAFSYSRSGLVTLCFGVVAVLLLVLLRAFRERNTEWIWLVLGFGAMMFWLMAKMAVHWTIGQRSVDDPNLAQAFGDGYRLTMSLAALRLGLEHPILGGGAGNFASGVYRMVDSGSLRFGDEPFMAHNELLQVVADYGYLAAITLLVLLLVPLGKTLWKYITASEWRPEVWAAVGLLGMLVQSNFDCIFHTAPCVLVAGLLLGAITRRDWQDLPVEQAELPSLLSSKRIPAYLRRGEAALKEPAPSRAWPGAVVNFSHAYLAGDFNARYRLLDALQISDDPGLRQTGFRLALAINSDDRAETTSIIREIVARAIVLIESEGLQHWFPTPALNRHATFLTRIRNSAVAALAVASAATGIHLCRSLVHAWRPLYAVDQLGIEQRFLRLASVLDANPYLGLQRAMLTEFLFYLPSYATFEYRRNVAAGYYPTFKRLAVDVGRDPQLALQLAAIAGWAGRTPEALRLMDTAIEIQAGHENVYKALYLKGEYLTELAQSGAGSDPPDEVADLARRALDCLEESKRRMPYALQKEINPMREQYIELCRQLIAVVD